ncbi:hypothetical protein EUTSA_v10013099mg [Eutrema salsugineum]|uniref:Protein kinase domain-containing protein n=1 Tax=Eutrema salsugineum TaxID=72664 RepID=V4N994_EUTSA|nr:hypothetical protein EUTSA_v10013099mg [Eutrema salsugineum]
MSDEDHGNDNGSIGLSNGDGGSDNGSGTQSSWTKRASDIKSTSPSYQLPDAPNMNLGTYGNRWERFNELKEVENQNEQRGMGLQAGMCMSTKAEEPGSLEKDAKYSIQALERNNSDMQNCSSGNSQVESKTPSSNPEDLKGLDLKSLKITLTKPREAGTYRMGDRSVLRHSNHSAFSKYNNGATSANKAPEENVGSCSPHDSSIAKIMCSGSSSDNPLNQQSSGSDRAAQREAALMKFRLKRKERCFEKKVRYYSRKKLAEQRPRVKGQFIRNNFSGKIFLGKEKRKSQERFISVDRYDEVEKSLVLFQRKLKPSGSSPPLLSHSGVTFRWHEILDGTLNLRDTNFLGRGNFGRVFRCDFPRINKVGAAKIQDIQNPQAHPEFVAEITTLHAANHPNVIKLLGKCFAPEHRVIVYEFMPKGSLDHLLYAHMPGPGLEQEYQVLSWETRMNIAVGVAEALVYLHDGIKMIHRDIKVGNILLDEDFVPRLTDFGLATRILVDSRGDEQQRNIDPVKGTPGYIAPETEQHALVSSKSDVYSYGVFLFALFTGRKAYEFNRVTRVEKRLTNWV